MCEMHLDSWRFSSGHQLTCREHWGSIVGSAQNCDEGIKGLRSVGPAHQTHKVTPGDTPSSGCPDG